MCNAGHVRPTMEKKSRCQGESGVWVGFPSSPPHQVAKGLKCLERRRRSSTQRTPFRSHHSASAARGGARKGCKGRRGASGRDRERMVRPGGLVVRLAGPGCLQLLTKFSTGVVSGRRHTPPSHVGNFPTSKKAVLPLFPFFPHGPARLLFSRAAGSVVALLTPGRQCASVLWKHNGIFSAPTAISCSVTRQGKLFLMLRSCGCRY